MVPRHFTLLLIHIHLLLLLTLPSCFIFHNSLANFVEARKTIIDALSEQKQQKRFYKLLVTLQNTRLIPLINHLKTATFFAPDNKAFKGLDIKDITRDQMLYHILYKEIKKEGFKNEELLVTQLDLGEKLGGENIGQRLNIEIDEKNTYFVGNAKITEFDLQSDNGIIHVVSELLIPPKDIFTTLSLIAETNLFTDYLKMKGLDRVLKDKNHTTVFVPTNDAINHQLKYFQKNYLTSECGGGLNDLDLLVKYLLSYSKVLYTESIQDGESEVDTVQGEKLKISRNQNDIYVGNGLILRKNLLAENGVIHVLNNLSLPNALYFTKHKYLCGLNASIFADSIIENHLEKYIDELTTQPFTILAPGNDVFYIDPNTNKNNTKEILKYHFLNGKYTINNLTNKMLIKTELITERLNNQNQRIKVPSSSIIKFNNAIVIDKHEPVEIDNSIIYMISEVEKLPVDIMKTIIQNKQLSSFVLSMSASEKLNSILDAKGITVFAPINSGFTKLGLINHYLLTSKGQADLDLMVGYHVLDKILYFEDIPEGESIHYTIEGNELKIIKQGTDVYIEDGHSATTSVSVITSSNNLISNGVMHVIDNVLLPPSLIVTVKKLLIGADADVMLELIKVANLTELILDSNETYTILSPTDKAFIEMNFTKLLDDAERVARLLLLHIIPGEIEDLREGKELQTLLSNDAKLVVRKDIFKGGYMLEVKGHWSFMDKAGILNSGKARNNGTVYLVDKVLLPEHVSEEPIGKTFLGFVIGLLLFSFVSSSGAYGWAWILHWRNLGHELNPLLWWRRWRDGYTSIP
ncbi:6952_t:CDS:2 [Entrophospora sp. SA101]|nr:6952_t:CDS:2 [Entrophospora sp. SA101]